MFAKALADRRPTANLYICTDFREPAEHPRRTTRAFVLDEFSRALTDSSLTPSPGPHDSACTTIPKRPRRDLDDDPPRWFVKYGTKTTPLAAVFHAKELRDLYLAATNPTPKTRGRPFAPVPENPTEPDFLGFREPNASIMTPIRRYCAFCCAYDYPEDEDWSIAMWATALARSLQSDSIKRYVSCVNTYLEMVYGKPRFLLPPRTFFKSYVNRDDPVVIADERAAAIIPDGELKHILLSGDLRTQLLAWFTVTLAARAADVISLIPRRINVARLDQAAFSPIELPGLGKLIWCTVVLHGLTKNTVSSVTYRDSLRSDHIFPFPLPPHLADYLQNQPANEFLFEGIETRHYPKLFGRFAKDFKKTVVSECHVDNMELSVEGFPSAQARARLIARHVGPQTTTAYMSPQACEAVFVQLGLPEFWDRYLKRILSSKASPACLPLKE